MYIEPRQTGWIEVICGPMFSGKTEELIRRLRRALFAKQQVQVFKPRIDTRYAEVEIVSHSKQRLSAQPIGDASEILTMDLADLDVVAIDEAQFFGSNIVDVVQQLANKGIRVIVAGLDQDFRGEPFGPMPHLLAIAEFVTKSLAICMVCGDPAGRSQRISKQTRKVLLGAEDAYEARCRRCHACETGLPGQPTLFDTPESTLPV